MPYGDPDPDDPNVLVGVQVPSDAETVREMAYAFAEEFAGLGMNEEGLLGLFRQPFYAGPHCAYQILGEVEVRRIVRESLACRPQLRTVVAEPPGEPAAAGEQPVKLVQIGSADP